MPVRIRRENGFDHWVLARRSLTDPAQIIYYVCYGPVGTRLRDVARVAGARRQVEECFQAAKNECGLDHYQVRHYDVWYRHITLSMAALAALTAIRAQELSKGAPLLDKPARHPCQSQRSDA